jgi:acetylornithine deacetylase
VNVFQLTRALVDIPSVTEDERAVAEFLERFLGEMAASTGGKVERQIVTEDRWNVFAAWGEPVVTLSTHMDVVPPWYASDEDEERIWGRGACDAKGIIAAMITAAGELLKSGQRNFGLLFLVGEERNSAGAYVAAKQPRGSRYVINGEPTENKLALGSKGSLRYELIAKGRMAHSAYPELGESAIDKLLTALEVIRSITLPSDPLLGPSTLNIGTISGGRAPNVIADEARAELLIRLVDDGAATREHILRAAEHTGIEAKEVLRVPAVHLESLPGFETDVVAFTTDIPAFGGAWGKPLLIGPGSIHVAHTTEEHIEKQQLTKAVEIYRQLVVRLS